MTRDRFPSQVPQIRGALRELAAAMDELDEVAARIYGLNRTDMRALEIVSRSGPVAPTELARKLGFTTGGITTVVDRLEKAGYVRRQKDPHDRRRLVVEATDRTRQRDEAVFGGMAGLTARLLKGFGAGDLAAITSFLEKAAELTAGYATKLAEMIPLDTEE